MLVALNLQRIDNIIAGFAASKDKYVLYINTSNWYYMNHDTKKAKIKDYYKDYIPVDTGEHAEVFDSPDTFIEFKTEVNATATAFDWFPQKTELQDSDYYIEVYVVAPNGTIPYNNLGITPTS